MTYTFAAIGVPTQENAMPGTPFDPLLLLLRRYEAIISAIKSTRPAEVAEADLDRIYREGSQRTMREIISASPPTTTAEGAVAALDHVLADEAIWREIENYGGKEMLRYLIVSARDFIARTQLRPYKAGKARG